MVKPGVENNFIVPHEAKSTYNIIKGLFEDSVLSLSSKSQDCLPKKCQYQVLQESHAKLEKELEEAKTALSGSCENVERLQEEYRRLKKETEERNNHNVIISRKKAALEKEHALLANTKLSSHDEDLLEKTILQYKALRNMTQVLFSFERSGSDLIEGYVFNKINNKMHHFSINTSKLNEGQIQEHIMLLMKEASGPNFADVPLE